MYDYVRLCYRLCYRLVFFPGSSERQRRFCDFWPFFCWSRPIIVTAPGQVMTCLSAHFGPRVSKGQGSPESADKVWFFLGSKTSHWSILDLIGSHGSHSFQERMIQLLGDANPTFLWATSQLRDIHRAWWDVAIPARKPQWWIPQMSP